VAEASSMGVTGWERALFGRAVLRLAVASVLRRRAGRIGKRDGRRRRTVGVVGNAGGQRGGTRGQRGGTGGQRGGTGGQRGGRNRAGRTTVGEAGDIWTRNDEPVKSLIIDVRPLNSVVHSGEAGEIAGGWLVGASIQNIDLTTVRGHHIESKEQELKIGYIHATWVVLRLPRGMKGNDLIANQLWVRKERQFCQAEVLMHWN
jgi:hypothetical protein